MALPQNAGFHFLILCIKVFKRLVEHLNLLIQMQNYARMGGDSVQKRNINIVAGSHSHYFLKQPYAIDYFHKKFVGAASCRDK